MRIAVLSCILGKFDTPIDPVAQSIPHAFYRFTDENFPPITGLTPRLQYRIPKLFGWQMFPGYDVYIWLDGSMSFTHKESVAWFLGKLGGADAAFFKHPQRKTIKEEVEHIELKLRKENKYITTRYKNGLHRQQLEEIKADKGFTDDILYTSTAFVYRNNDKVRAMMRYWWYYQSRYFTCDQVSQPYAVYLSKARVNLIKENQFKIPYLELVSPHK